MAEAELLLLLLSVVAAVTLIAGRIGVPYPILMVIAGLILGLVLGLFPGVPSVELDPDTVLVVFLPPILFSGAYSLSPRDLWRNIRPITLLAVGLVIATTAAVAAGAMAVAPGIGWPVAITLGAIVSPPDAISVTAIARRMKLPRRLVIIFEGESLVNDATALSIYRFAVPAAIAGSTFDLGGAAIGFIGVVLGGLLIGLVVGLGASRLLSALDEPPVEVLLTLLIPFVAYLPAESLGVSGVLAVVTAGLIAGWRSPRVMGSNARLLATSTWTMVIFVVNGLAFLLVGLQLRSVARSIESASELELLGAAALVSITVIVVRLAWVYPATYVPRWLVPSISRRDPAPPLWTPLILGWGGMRGAVTLAAALALPATFPERSEVIFLAFSVILVTLIGQGLTLPWVIRALHVEDDDSLLHEEMHARRTATDAALARIDEMREELPNHLPLLNQLKERYDHREEHLVHEHADDLDGVLPALTPEEIEEMEHDEIRRSLISAERLAVLELRDRGEITVETLRRIERDLDLDELRREA
jgi:CPA1 family monovalent cation:H+ antiporter